MKSCGFEASGPSVAEWPISPTTPFCQQSNYHEEATLAYLFDVLSTEVTPHVHSGYVTSEQPAEKNLP